MRAPFMFSSRATSRVSNELSCERLLHGLMRELFQTETSAVRHCRKEAERMLGTPPAETLLAVAQHAQSTLRSLPSVARAEALPMSRAGIFTGTLFSAVRDKLADPMTTSERSYRGTLLGTRHGLDLVLMLRALADESVREELFAFCESWLTARTVLVEELEEHMHWFAQHPACAICSPRTLKGTRRAPFWSPPPVEES